MLTTWITQGHTLSCNIDQRWCDAVVELSSGKAMLKQGMPGERICARPDASSGHLMLTIDVG